MLYNNQLSACFDVQSSESSLTEREESPQGSHLILPKKISDLFHFSLKLVKVYTKKRVFVPEIQKRHLNVISLITFIQNQQK